MRKVLVVEDDKVQARMVTFRLKQAGFEVYSVGEGGDALGLIRAHKPQVVLLDLGLPLEDAFSFHWDGIKILGWIRQQKPPRPSAIIITGQPPEIKDKLIKQGATHFFTKPVDIAKLVEAVNEAAQKSEEEAKYAAIDGNANPAP
jgi:CheY-like chemotaxis protein